MNRSQVIYETIWRRLGTLALVKDVFTDATGIAIAAAEAMPGAGLARRRWVSP